MRLDPLVGAIALVSLTACVEPQSDLPLSLNVVLDPIHDIGAADGDEWESFDGIWDVEVDSDGRVAILDLGGPAVRTFDSAGRHLGSLQSRGLEPGQIEDPMALAWTSAGSLSVWDPGSSWVSRFEVSNHGVEFSERWRAFAFGETGFCSHNGRSYLSYWQDDLVVHEISEGGILHSFGSAPTAAGVEALGPELQEIAIEELTPSALLCTARGVLDASFTQSSLRLHDPDGGELWSRSFDDFRPIVAYSDDGIGLGRAFDSGEGSHLLRSVVPWGPDHVLVQHELRRSEFPEEGEAEVVESRLLSLADGDEVDRVRSLPLVLAANGSRLYLPRREPFVGVTVVEIR